MTIPWLIFCIVMSLFVILAGIFFHSTTTSTAEVVVVWVVVVVLIAAIWGGSFWYFSNTASGQRALIDEHSNIANGLNRTITVYTADGHILAQYNGRIDLAINEGGYVKFDFDGKRYIYYNCFVETIADVGN